MGAFYELTLTCTLKEAVPQQVIETLNYLTWQTEKEPERWPEHSLFKEERRDFAREVLSRGGVVYLPDIYTVSFKTNERFNPNQYYLNVRTYIKSTTYDEIELFLHWLAPYCDVQEGSGSGSGPVCVGYFRKERQRNPSLIYFGKDGAAYYLDNHSLDDVQLELITDEL